MIGSREIVELIEKVRVDKRITRARLCEGAGITPKAYRQLISGSTPSLETALNLLREVGISVLLLKVNEAEALLKSLTNGRGKEASNRG